jgi:DNA ligase-1
MNQLTEGSPVQVPGKNYVMRNVGGVYSCSCPAWRNQSRQIDLRTCKHLCAYLGVESERARVGNDNMPTKFKRAGADPLAKATVVQLQTDQVVVEVVEDKNYPCLLANTYKDQDPTGWWISEKMDGVRAVWTGRDFRTRNDNVLFAPDWFKAGMPSERLDGELWLGRDMFEETMSIVRRHEAGDRWKNITYRVFDAQDLIVNFEGRQAHLRSLSLPAHVQVLQQTKCTGKAHLDQELAKVMAVKGEGLMLRKPNSRYEFSRSSTLLKVKPFYDMEVIVTNYTAGKGKYKGVVGALVCDLDGKSFKVGGGLTDKERANPPSVGTTITIKYQQLTKKGIPRHGSYVRVYEAI